MRLETSTWGGHSTLLTYFLPLLSVTQISPTCSWALLPPNEDQTAGGVRVTSTESGWWVWHFRCVFRKRWEASWVSLPLISISSSFLLDSRNCGRGALGSLFTRRRELLRTEGAVDSSRNSNREEENLAQATTSDFKSFISSHAPLFYEQITGEERGRQ